jgi:hypothetical protein
MLGPMMLRLGGSAAVVGAQEDRNAGRTPVTPARGPARTATAAVLALAALKVIATMAFAGRYGWHRDELYYLACARHLALGYVDFPPVTPLLAHLDVLVFGASLTGLRFLTALAGGIMVVLIARIARELGGSSGAQVLAAAALLLNPLFLGANLLFQTVTFDQLAWLVTLYLFVRLLRTGNSRLWLALGVSAGIGLETKYTIAALLAGIFCGLFLSPLRRDLRTPWPWLGAAIAVALLAPNLVWQVQHAWTSLNYIYGHSGNTGSRLQFIVETLLLLGPIGLPLAYLGVRYLFREPWLRTLAWATVITALLLLAASGKSYYAGPLYPLLLAAGSIPAARLFSQRPRITRAVSAVLVLLTLALVPVGLPVLPARAAIDAGMTRLRKDYADMFGWRELAATTARVYDALPPGERRHTIIWGSNYGEAGAIDLYGPQYGLPSAISTHLTYFYWKPAHVDDSTVIVIGGWPALLRPLFADIRRVAVLHNAYGVDNEENGRFIYLCRKPRVSLDAAWPSLQAYD